MENHFFMGLMVFDNVSTTSVVYIVLLPLESRNQIVTEWFKLEFCRSAFALFIVSKLVSCINTIRKSIFNVQCCQELSLLTQ